MNILKIEQAEKELGKITLELIKYFPGLIDHVSEINGADLVETLTALIHNDTALSSKQTIKAFIQNNK